jgi:hypothetical protein
MPKALTIVTLIALVVGVGVLSSIHRSVVWQRDSSELVWSGDEAYLFVSRRNEGWSGNLIELGWQYFKGWLHRSGDLSRSGWWLEVTRLTPTAATRTAIGLETPITLRFAERQMYAMYKGVFSRWQEDRFVPVDSEERRRVEPLLQGPSTSNAQGWSSAPGITGLIDANRTYSLVLGGVPLDVVVSATADRRTISAKWPEHRSETLLDISTGPLWVDRPTYARMMSPVPR